VKTVSIKSLDELVEAGVIQLTRGKIISKKDMAACPGNYPVYSSAKENDGKFGEYGRFMFDEELITWSVDGGGRLFYRPKHKFSVTNVGGVLRILDRAVLDYRYLFYALTLRHSEISFDWVKKAHPSVIRKLYADIPVLSITEQQRIVGILDDAFDGIATAKDNSEQNLQNARALFESHLHGVTTEKALLGDLVNITTGKLDANAAVDGGKFPFFTCSREIYAINDYAFDCEAILLAGNNAVGDFNVKHYKGKFNAYQRTYVITVNEQGRVLYRFLYFQMLKSLKKFKAQSVGVGTKFLKLGMIKEMEIELPSLEEQKRIVSTMNSVREETQRLESLYQRKLAALDELKKSLLHQAFSGAL
jgi:type I restriction enzyme S subunit